MTVRQKMVAMYHKAMSNISLNRQVQLAVTLLFGVGLNSYQAAAQTTVIHAGHLLTLPGQPPLAKQTIVIEDAMIKQVLTGFVAPATIAPKALLIDLSDQFVMPGLIDSHVHFQFEMGPDNERDLLKMSTQLNAMRSVHFANKTLLAGFTTVRDAGSDGISLYALRDAINQGWVVGPRILAAGKVGITGGHMDVSGMNAQIMAMYTSDTAICDGPYECRRASRHGIKYGADWIKVAATGGVLTDSETGTAQQMQADELVEIVQAAKSMGRKVMAHAHQEEGIIAALEAGVASVEHGTYASDRVIQLFKKHNAYLVPTLLAGHTVVDMAKNTDIMSPAIKAKARVVGRDMNANFTRAYKAGVNIAFGTDSGVSKHGDNAMEAVLMVDAGMPAAEVIKSATVNAAQLLDLSDRVGTIEVGKLADIIATQQSPINDIKQLTAVTFVMKNGVVYRD